MLATRHLLFAISAVPLAAHGSIPGEAAPDKVRMNDGTELRGLILQNTRDTVVIETSNGEARLPKEYIRRIDDAPGDEAVFADIVDNDDLPSWRSIVHDMRAYDGIRNFQQIPPAAIHSGLLRHIPYLSFKVNSNAELNIYGSPDRPAAVEFGVYGAVRSTELQRRMFRVYIAGHLQSKEQIAALYSLSPGNCDAQAGKLGFRLILPGDPDSYGGTWIVVYRPDRVERARKGEREYTRTTQAFERVDNSDLGLRSDRNWKNRNWLEALRQTFTGEETELRGFYRDREGVFHVLTDKS